jgi:hypothetical protein
VNESVQTYLPGSPGKSSNRTGNSISSFDAILILFMYVLISSALTQCSSQVTSGHGNSEQLKAAQNDPTGQINQIVSLGITSE